MRAIQRGFTLIELMLVVAIIGVTSSLAIPYYRGMTARANRAEAQVVLNKMRVYFVNLYESNDQNKGTFVTPNTPVGVVVPANPTTATIPMGQPAPWDPTPAAWKDIAFPPEGAIKMRYTFQIATTGPVVGDTLKLIACGNFPGLGPANQNCGTTGLKANYVYEEDYVGTALANSVEFPAM